MLNTLAAVTLANKIVDELSNDMGTENSGEQKIMYQNIAILKILVACLEEIGKIEDE